MLQPYSNNNIARIVKRHKIYFMDTGLACFLAGYQAIKNFDIVEKFGVNVGNGGVVCLANDIFPLDRNNNLIPIELL